MLETVQKSKLACLGHANISGHRCVGNIPYTVCLHLMHYNLGFLRDLWLMVITGYLRTLE